MSTFSPFSEETLHELSLPLNPDRVSVMNDGPARGVPYLDGEDVTRRANEVFGFGNWGFELLGLPVLVEKEGNYEVWAAHGRLHVRGAMPVSDAGTCVRSGDKAPGLEMAYKGCVTDAMKRCLKQLGDQFGLVLYDKTVSAAELRQAWLAATGQGRASAAPRDLNAEADALQAAAETPVNAAFDAFMADCTKARAPLKAICIALGFTPETAEEAHAYLETRGPDQLDAWIEANPGKQWTHLVAGLTEARQPNDQWKRVTELMAEETVTSVQIKAVVGDFNRERVLAWLTENRCTPEMLMDRVKARVPANAR